MKKVTILGSTGSIGITSLDVIRLHKGEFKLSGISANSNYVLLAKQANEFKPDFIAIAKKEFLHELETRLEYKPKIFSGANAVQELASNSGADLVLNAVVGFAGLLPTLSALNAGINVALANKESLVVAGELVTELVVKKGLNIIPVDSEHNAVFQCLHGNHNRKAERIILTASGGPLLKHPLQDLSSVTVEQALNHPTWGMGKKISIDSATMVNKGLELIEAKYLFNIPMENIDVVIHPQSIVHGMLEFSDGSCMAVMGPTSMSVPIIYALYYPDYAKMAPAGFMDFTKTFSLDFMAPDIKRFPALSIARNVAKQGATYPAVFNAANEVAVQAFLDKKIKFTDIIEVIKNVLDSHNGIKKPDIQTLLEVDAQARVEAESICNKRGL